MFPLMTVCSYHVTYALLERDSNSQPLSSSVKTQPFSQTSRLAKWLSPRLPTKWLWVQIPLQTLDDLILFKV